jgi:hypothetical protein
VESFILETVKNIVGFLTLIVVVKAILHKIHENHKREEFLRRLMEDGQEREDNE